MSGRLNFFVRANDLGSFRDLDGSFGRIHFSRVCPWHLELVFYRRSGFRSVILRGFSLLRFLDLGCGFLKDDLVLRGLVFQDLGWFSGFGLVLHGIGLNLKGRVQI